jgi:hypothetical protein
MGGNTCPPGQSMQNGICVSSGTGGTGGYKRGGRVKPKRKMQRGGRIQGRTRPVRKMLHGGSAQAGHVDLCFEGTNTQYNGLIVNVGGRFVSSRSGVKEGGSRNLAPCPTQPGNEVRLSAGDGGGNRMMGEQNDWFPYGIWDTGNGNQTGGNNQLMGNTWWGGTGAQNPFEAGVDMLRKGGRTRKPKRGMKRGGKVRKKMATGGRTSCGGPNQRPCGGQYRTGGKVRKKGRRR